MIARRFRLSVGNHFVAVMTTLFAVTLTAQAGAGTMYIEGFDFDTTDAVADYPAFSGSLATGTAVVSSGLLVLDSNANNTQDFTRAGFAMPHVLSTWVGASNSGGSYNVGLVIGQNQVVFHPGYAGAALRVEGPGGFGNTDVGFTPANGVLHRLEVASDGRGNYHVTLTDGANPANVFTTSFFNPGSVGGPVGLRRSGGATGSGQFDDLTVDVGPGVVYSETFENELFLSGVDATSTEGKLQMQTGTGTWTRSGPAGAYTVTVRVGADAGNGSYNVGLQIGQNSIVFHPGYAGAALRVEGPGGFGNTNVGFTPANGVLHKLEVASDGSGNYHVTLTDGANPANVFTTSFINPGSVGGDVGLRRSGPTSGVGLYDDFSIVPASGRPTLDTFNNAFSTSLAGGTAASVDGVLRLTGPDTVQVWNLGSHGDDQFISVEVGAETTSPGSFNVGLGIGENAIVFHPGYAGAALRVEGPGGFGNTDVGFTPALDTLHLLEVRAHPNGLFEFTLTNRDDPTQVYLGTFFNPAAVGGDIFLRRSGQPLGAGLFDNVVVQAVPEPGSLALLALGAFGLGLVGRRCRKRK